MEVTGVEPVSNKNNDRWDLQVLLILDFQNKVISEPTVLESPKDIIFLQTSYRVTICQNLSKSSIVKPLKGREKQSKQLCYC